VEINEQDGLFYRILSEMTGLEIDGEHRLISLMTELARIKKNMIKFNMPFMRLNLKDMA